MVLQAVVVLLVMCAVGTSAVQCDGCHQYVRTKRGKFYPGPPQRFYSRPPISFSTKGAFSYTPPPGYMMDDEPSYPGFRPAKVTRRPNEGLGDEDITNIVKYLTKQDLDKIIEFAGEKEKVESHRDNNYDEFRPPSDSSKVYKSNIAEINSDKNIATYQEKPFDVDANSNFNYVPDTSKVYSNPGKYSPYSNVPLDTEESMRNSQVSTLHDAFGSNPSADIPKEEDLPRAVNLREDYDVSYTNNVPTVVKADGSSYKLENFGDLPLMNYNSKLHSLSSYHVPHYTVTTQVKTVDAQPAPAWSSSYAPRSNPPPPPIEPAPPVSAAKEQSDAHLKATRIWSHRSKGTAYTLHNDGTLSLEKPSGRYHG